MKAASPPAAPAPTHIITGPARRFWMDEDNDSLLGQHVTVRVRISSNSDSTPLAARLRDGGWCHVAPKHLREL